MTVRELIKTLLDYPMDVNVTIYDRDNQINKNIIYVGASPNDNNAWYDENEIPDKASYIEILISNNN